MDTFTSYRTFLDQALAKPLPGLEAHRQMVPLSRRMARERLQPRPDARESAVMIVIYPQDGVPHLLMIVRPSYEGVHSGQIAFPGGRKEDSDSSFLDTAVRETREEIGLDVRACPGSRIHGPLSYLYIPPSNFKVYPFVSSCAELPGLQGDPEEVSEILRLPLSAFLDGSSIGEEWFTSSYATVKAPCYQVNGYTIWGASAMMLSELCYISMEWYARVRG